MEQDYVIFSPQKNAYVAVDDRANTSLTTNIQLARRFKERAAKNFLANNLKNTSGVFKLKAVETKQVKESTIREPVKTGHQSIMDVVNANTPKMFDDLEQALIEQVQQFELQMIDLYHYIGNNANLPAHKGYKMYKKLAELVQDRAKVKAQLKAVHEAKNFRYVPYTPRTELYEQLIEL